MISTSYTSYTRWLSYTSFQLALVLVLATAPPTLYQPQQPLAATLAPDPTSAGLLGVPGANPGVSPAQHSEVMWGVWWGHMMHTCMMDVGHEMEIQTEASACTLTVTAS